MNRKYVNLQMADEKYVNGKISVWWDIENCGVPKVCNPDSIAQNISSALAKVNYCGPISISAYGNTKGIPDSVQHALNSTGISLNHVPAGVKDASDKKILVDMLLWAVDNPAPATYLLISGDRDFSNALHQLRMRRYNILLAQPQHASAPLVAAAKSVWRWTSLLAGQPPLTDGESAEFSSHISTSVLLQTQSTKVNPADSSPENSNPGSKKLPKEGSGTDVSHKGKQVYKNPSQLSMLPSSSNSKEAIAVQAALVVDMRPAELAHLPLRHTSDGPIEEHAAKFPCIQQIYPSPENPSYGNAAPNSPSQHNGDTQCSPFPTPVVCNFCTRNGHVEESCRRKHGLCLCCGASDHELSTCPSKSGQPKTDQPCGLSEPSTTPSGVHVKTIESEKFEPHLPSHHQEHVHSIEATPYSLPLPPHTRTTGPCNHSARARDRGRHKIKSRPCRFCQKTGHVEATCKWRHRLFFRCGTAGHQEYVHSIEATPNSQPPPPEARTKGPYNRRARDRGRHKIKRRPCRFCQKTGHIEASCSWKHRLCLSCGVAGHQFNTCPRNPAPNMPRI